MAYQFEPATPVQQGVRRILSEEVEYAVSTLMRPQTAKQRDKAIHEARKSLKKLRGLMKLLRPVLKSGYTRENRVLRDIGRSLSELRDAGAIIQTFETLIAEEREAAARSGAPDRGTVLREAPAARGSKALPAINEEPGTRAEPAIDDKSPAWDTAAVTAIRKGLRESKRATERELDPAQTMLSAASALAGFGERAARWRVREKAFAALAPGLADTYRAGRKAMHRATGVSDPVLWHDWRKRAKDHWYHVRLLSGLFGGINESRECRLHELESAIGDDHNLDVLCAKLTADPAAFGGEPMVHLFVAAAKSKQDRLRQRAVELGSRLYEQKPNDFVRECNRLWQLWQAGPPVEADAVKKSPHREAVATPVVKPRTKRR